MTRFVYLHGFASSPQSKKAQFFRQRFSELGRSLEILQLDEGNFEGLTISGQLGVVDRSVNGDPAILIGSSLGGYLAALYASRHPNVERLVLMAPAFQFPRRWRSRFSEAELEQWKRDGSRKFFHYTDHKDRALGYQFVEDALRYEDEPRFTQPALILQGLNDPVVLPEVARSVAERNSNVSLVLLESGHELTDVLDRIWSETVMFLGFQKP